MAPVEAIQAADNTDVMKESHALTDAELMGKLCTDFEFSLSLADPYDDDLKMLAVSRGFTALTGYEAHECVGRNCRFLVDGVPEEQKDQVDTEARKGVREWFATVKKTLADPNAEKIKPFSFMQLNAKKNGEVFRNFVLLDIVYSLDTAGGQHSIIRSAMEPTDLPKKPFCVGIQIGCEDESEGGVEAMKKLHVERLHQVRQELKLERVTDQIKCLLKLKGMIQG
jgi:hypothetical protein